MRMKLIAYALTFVLVTALSAQAETVITTTPGSAATTYSGVVSEIDPGAQTIILKSESAPAPVTYTYTPQTVFVDTQGNTVSYETIRNVPVTVEYVTEGGRTVVRRVIATQPPPVPAGRIIQRRTETRTETR
jgi:hypothetical protein